MDTFTQQRFLVRMERSATASWVWQWFNLPLPQRNAPDYSERLFNTMEDFRMAFFGKEWEIMTYLPEDEVAIEELEWHINN